MPCSICRTVLDDKRWCNVSHGALRDVLIHKRWCCKHCRDCRHVVDKKIYNRRSKN